jgi:hypothetical protein
MSNSRCLPGKTGGSPCGLEYALADAIVSWNFKHIVRIDKMRAYNQVNLQTGFGLLSIVSPQEVRFDEAT